MTFDWRNNPDGLPPIDLGAEPDGQPRNQFNERDLELLWANPITQVALDRGYLSVEQILALSYQPGTRPTGLSAAALREAVNELVRRVQKKDLQAPDEYKRRYSYVYTVETSRQVEERIERQEKEAEQEMIPHWVAFVKRLKNLNWPLVKLVDKFLMEEMDVYAKTYPEAFSDVTYHCILFLRGAIRLSKTHTQDEQAEMGKYINELLHDKPGVDYRSVRSPP